MRALEDMNRLIKNSKFIPQEQKQEYERNTNTNPVMDFFNNTIFKGNTNEKKSSVS